MLGLRWLNDGMESIGSTKMTQSIPETRRWLTVMALLLLSLVVLSIPPAAVAKGASHNPFGFHPHPEMQQNGQAHPGAQIGAVESDATACNQATCGDYPQCTAGVLPSVAVSTIAVKAPSLKHFTHSFFHFSHPVSTRPPSTR